MREPFEQAVAEGRAGDRLWLYATYHCNLACRYCLTESAPGILNRRTLGAETMIRAVREARELGFEKVGVTGGEVFMLPDFAETLRRIAELLPVVALTNGTLFTERRLRELEALAGLDVALQLSLDSADAAQNDKLRGRGNFDSVLATIPRLIEREIPVRIATTVEDQTPDELAALCELHRSLGVPDTDHIVRPVVRRGRAVTERLGVELGPHDVLPELTLTADGAFMHPFAATVRGGETDLDLLVSRQILPLEAPLRRFLALVGDQPVGDDVVRSLR
ncbi:MAG: radical SAM protein [Thermoleophilia bacterium]